MTKPRGIERLRSRGSYSGTRFVPIVRVGLFAACTLASAACTESTLSWESDDTSTERTDAVSDVQSDSTDTASELDVEPDSPEGDVLPHDVSDTETDADSGGPPPYAGVTRYRGSAIRSPMSLSLRAHAESTIGDALTRWPTFIKVGASETLSAQNLNCLQSISPESYEGGIYAGTLDTLQRSGPGGAPLFARESLAAEVGRSASWALDGSPSPVDAELDAIDAATALVSFGTNDMQQGSNSAAALFAFGENQSALLRHLQERDVLPIVLGLNPRDDTDTARWWVESFNTLSRALAERDQLPWLNIYNAMRELPNKGLADDGVHGSVFRSAGAAQPCATHPEALRFNYNLRNLLTLELMDALDAQLNEERPAEDAEGWQGEGTRSEPIVIDELPFSHFADTRTAGTRDLDAYPSCDSGQDQSGPELVYRLDVDAPTGIRAFIYDEGNADIDLHLLRGDSQASSCVLRDDRLLEASLQAGTYFLVADTYVRPTGDERRGEFVLVVVECHPADPSCWPWAQ